MSRFEGYSLAPGLARGRAWLLSPVLHRVVPRREIPDGAREEEITRLEAAVGRAQQEVMALKAKLAEHVAEAETGVLDAHVTMLGDPAFLTGVRHRIREGGINAEQAVSDEVDAMGALFARAGSAYLRERTADLRDIGGRLVDALMGPEGTSVAIDIPPDSIVVAHELLPSQAAGMDRSRVAGIVTSTGGSSSHAAILARAMGVPLVTGIARVQEVIPQGAPVLVDGDRGEVVCMPSAVERREFDEQRASYQRFLERVRLEEELPCETLDGVAVELSGNVASPEEADALVDHRLAGIGLMRTEFVFMTAATAPGVERQHEAYRKIIERVGPVPVTIRCMDLGGDKIPRFLLRNEGTGLDSPARGLRFALEHPTALLTQLRAIVRCAAEGPVRILFPMVAGGEELERALELVEQAVRAEGATSRPPVGAMIETPAALFGLDAIIEFADFLSVGTNDLTQYMLAVDRAASDADGYYSVLYPGILRALQMIVEEAGAAGCPLSICGEAAGHPCIAPLLVGLGVRQLSMSPARSAAVRHVIRSSRLADFEALAADILAAGRVDATRRILDERIKPKLRDEDL